VLREESLSVHVLRQDTIRWWSRGAWTPHHDHGTVHWSYCSPRLRIIVPLASRRRNGRGRAWQGGPVCRSCRYVNSQGSRFCLMSSSGLTIADFFVFPAFRYACALTIVSFLRSCIVSSIPAAPFSSKGPAVFCHPSAPFSHESTEPVHLHFVRWREILLRVIWVRGMGRSYVH
jgi:hypothetical protein